MVGSRMPGTVRYCHECDLAGARCRWDLGISFDYCRIFDYFQQFPMHSYGYGIIRAGLGRLGNDQSGVGVHSCIQWDKTNLLRMRRCERQMERQLPKAIRRIYNKSHSTLARNATFLIRKSVRRSQVELSCRPSARNTSLNHVADMTHLDRIGKKRITLMVNC